jgi:Na+-transporting methylmalonyl-CoA/oxaloacetate decarboxylase gamma subunit
MNFSFDQISFSNLFTADFNAVLFSLFGMSMVFGGLVVISLYIAILPKLLALPGRLKNRKNKATDTSKNNSETVDRDILIVIAAALHLNQNFPEEKDKITWKSHGDLESPWKISGRVHGLSIRNQVGVNNLRRR